MAMGKLEGLFLMFSVAGYGQRTIGKKIHSGEGHAMTITVDIRPEVRAELARQAAVHNRALEAYAASLLEDAARVPVETLPHDLLTGEESREGKATNLMELFEPIRGLLTDEEVDTLFSRNPSTGRPVDLG